MNYTTNESKEPLGMMNLNLMHALYVLCVLVFVSLGFAAYHSIDTYLRDSGQIAQSNVLHIKLEHFLSSLKDIQRGARGFVITGDNNFLDPYRIGVAELTQEINDLQMATGYSRDIPGMMHSLSELSDQLVSTTRAEVDFMQKGDFDSARQIVRDGKAKAAMDGVERMIRLMDKEESTLIEERSAEARSSLKDSLVLLAGGGGLTLVLMLVTFTVLSRQSSFRRRLAESLQLSEDRLQTVINSINEGITFSTSQGGFEVYNRRMRELTGYTAEEANRSGDFSHLLYPDPIERQNALDGVKFLMASPGVHSSETTITTKTGDRRILRVASQMITYHGRRMFLTTYDDITERRRAEAALRKAEDLYRSIVENAAEGMYQSTLDGSLLTANPEMARIFGFASPSELIKASANGTVPSYADDGRRRDFIQEVSVQGFVKNFESRAMRRDGQIIWIVENARALHDANGGLLGFEGTVTDISARKKVEEITRLDSEIMRELSEGVSLISVQDGSILYANPRFERMFGYEAGELINKSIAILYASPEGSHEQPVDSIPPELRSGGVWQGDTCNLRKDGTTVWCRTSVSPFRHPDFGDVMIGIHTDISERKRSEADRERLIEELRRALADVKTLSGLVPICSNCKKIRDDKGFWNQLEAYIQQRTPAQFSHGICPECAEKLYPEVFHGRRTSAH